ncbi:hypothetical protein AVJ23_14135 [Pseudoponticoccus marisrubri]|uniref:Transposase IS200-like domain-containing protein n=1 Tax=Pseudoponticoccus marisrubri TaxID=1685382 RepID=A0A0W7WHX3_9RHOB|nr:hypothetical protein AVJ23_14135 [Pseudoponticoccus marisrubri]
MPDGTYFFTLALEPGAELSLVDQIEALRRAYAATVTERPFETQAIVVLPDHLHAVWTLPPGDSEHVQRWRLIKSRFLREAGITSRRRSPARGPWQRPVWMHRIRDGPEFRRHRSYCWMDPVRHGLTGMAEDWPHSSIHRELARGRVLRGFHEDPDLFRHGTPEGPPGQGMGAGPHPAAPHTSL